MEGGRLVLGVACVASVSGGYHRGWAVSRDSSAKLCVLNFVRLKEVRIIEKSSIGTTKRWLSMLNNRGSTVFINYSFKLSNARDRLSLFSSCFTVFFLCDFNVVLAICSRCRSITGIMLSTTDKPLWVALMPLK